MPETTRNAPGQCALANGAVQGSAPEGFGAANNKTSGQFERYPVVGFNHLISTSRGDCAADLQDPHNLTNPINKLCGLTDLATRNVRMFTIGPVCKKFF